LVKSWIDITKVYPIPKKKSDEVLWVFNHYLKGIYKRDIAHSLQLHLIHKSMCELGEMSLSYKDIKKYNFQSMDGLLKIRESISKIGYIDINNCDLIEYVKSKKKDFKSMLQSKMLISMEDKYRNALAFIEEFIVKYYINDARVRAMKVKAQMIITKLLDFYMQRDDMLPNEYRNRIEYSAQRLFYTNYMDVESNPKLALKYLQERVSERNVQINKYKEMCKEHTQDEDIKECLYEYISSIKSKGINVPDIIDEIAEYNRDKNCEIIITEDHLMKLCNHISKARVITDYIACMSDRMAEKKYNEIVSSSTKWSMSYHD